MIYVTSDLHLNHKNIIAYSNRPFNSLAEMNEGLIKEWNRKVKPQDIIIHIGDFFFGSDVELLDLFGKLNGQIKLISGNHDEKLFERVFWNLEKYNLSSNAKKNLIYRTFPEERAVIYDQEKKRRITLLRDIYEFSYKGEIIVMSHYPIESWHWMMKKNTIHFHGHCHGKLGRTLPRRLDIGWDVHHSILSLDEAIEKAKN